MQVISQSNHNSNNSTINNSHNSQSQVRNHSQNAINRLLENTTTANNNVTNNNSNSNFGSNLINKPLLSGGNGSGTGGNRPSTTDNGAGGNGLTLNLTGKSRN